MDKAHTGRPSLPYEDAVEEALCFGWIDSLIQKVDEDTYGRLFTPRTNTAKWSAVNLRRVRKVIAEGRMTGVGLAKIESAILAALEKEVADAGGGTMAPSPGQQAPGPCPLVVPDFITRGLEASSLALENFSRMAPSYRKLYVGWICDAKREETRNKRLAEAIAKLERNEKLGLK